MIHLGDITKIHGDKIEPVDCITFGSPCQDLSIAGHRAGLAGERSGLFVEAIRIIKEMRAETNGMYPTFAVWENVPGAFSSNGGEDFRAVLEELARVEQPNASIPRPTRGGRWSKAGAIAGNGWSVAWRQLDAQYWGVAQRRKRIALVADFRGQRAGAVLFERTSLSGNLGKSIQPWETFTRTAQNCTAGYDRVVGAGSFCISGNTVDRKTNQNGTGVKENTAFALNTVDRPAVAYSLKIRSGCAGGGKGALVQTEKSATLSTLQDQTLFQLVCFDNHAQDARYSELQGISPTVTARWGTGGGNTPIVARKTFSEQDFYSYSENGKSATLKAKTGNVGNGSETLVAEKQIRWIVRRLTPTECERLQGYPDGWTDIGEWVDTKGKKHKPADTPRYKALGNSIALPQWFWIAQKMKPYLESSAKLGSLFDGIGGFPLVWETTYGKGTARWASEIEEFPIAVTKKWFKE